MALSLWSWAVAGVVQVEGDVLAVPVRLSMVFLQVLVGALFMMRRPAQRNGDMNSILRAAPSILVAGLLFKLAQPLTDWAGWMEGLFVGGTVLTAVSLGSLWREFAVLPARREVIRRGPYRWLRHPAYLGELMMVTACAAAAGIWPAWVLYVAVWPLVVLRIAEEERLLSGVQAYGKFKAKTRWRLIPGIW